jgi:hypothetical protein
MGGGGVESKLGPLGTAATNGLLFQTRMIMMMEKFGGMMMAGETEVLGENLAQCRSVHHKPHMPTRTRTWAAAVGSQLLTA